MKTLLLMSLFLLAGVVFLPQKANAQSYGSWNSPLNNYIRARMTNKIIRNNQRRTSGKHIVRNRKKVVRRKTHHKSRSVSAIEFLIKPKLTIENLLSLQTIG